MYQELEIQDLLEATRVSTEVYQELEMQDLLQATRVE